jgi:hypothetical protein
MIGLLVLLVYCGLLVGVLVPRRKGGFDRRRARTSVHSLNGPNSRLHCLRSMLQTAALWRRSPAAPRSSRVVPSFLR